MEFNNKFVLREWIIKKDLKNGYFVVSLIITWFAGYIFGGI